MLLDPPATVRGVAGLVHALEFAPADSPEVAGIVDVPQVESAAYLDENFEVLGRPEVASFERKTPRPGTTKRFLRGDADVDGSDTVADALRILTYFFLGGDPFDCQKAADANDDGRVTMNDAFHTLLHLFRGAPLPPPNQLCDLDPTRDQLKCESFAGCF